MAEQKLFEKFINSLQIDVSEYLDSELTEFQNNLIEDATFIFKDNIIGEIKKLGGNLKKNKEKFQSFLVKAEKELEGEQYKDVQKELKQMFKEYSKALRKLIEKTCVAIIPVKEMPWVDVIFRSVPRLVIDKKNVNFLDNSIAYYGEIKCLLSKTIIYGKMKDAEPLFAPFMGDLDLEGYKLDDSQKEPKSQIYSYVSAIIKALDSKLTSTQLEKYHEGYQRHGDPICDFLMSKRDLLTSMGKIRSGLESSRDSNASVCGIGIPLINDNTSLILIIDEGNDQDRFAICFEALIKFSAACCEIPSSQKAGGIQTQVPSQPTGTVRTPGGQELQAWTVEELAEAAQQRGGAPPPGMEFWTEENLRMMAEKRTDGIPQGMEVWTEEDLEELARKRKGGVSDIPEWEADNDLTECVKCGYSLRKGWSECPICNTPVSSASSATPSPPPEDKADKDKDTKEEVGDKTEPSESLESSKNSGSKKNENSSS
ncbi:MAG: hypothetical protein EU529_07065 [Promethearchaeota archaeon]|nr:MAG: hypothetical protein EU529_07065 [Candidatus Lokiarchaeota archaeon]